jgi:NAD(P)-dependent dehydrogenase (short-subunit alcohol dehydrogenase family)
MRIVVIGATGTIGRAVTAALTAQDHEVIPVSRPGVDLATPSTVDAVFTEEPLADAVICCAASGRLTRLADGSDEEFTTGVDTKLLGQVHLVRRAVRHLRAGGSVTITSGRFDQPTPGGAFGALVNSGLEAFVRAAAAELPQGPRVNAVSPGWVSETLTALGMPDHAGTPAAEVARAYVDAVEGTMTGETLRP